MTALTLHVIPRYLIYTSKRDDKHPFPPLQVSYVSFFPGWQTDTFFYSQCTKTVTILRFGFTFTKKTLKLSWNKDNVYVKCEFSCT